MTRPYAVFSSHALLPSPFRGSSLSARISEVRRRFSNTLHNFCCTQFLPPMRRTGALLVGVPVPSKVGRWPSTAFGFLGTANTPCFHGPLCDQRSLRLFLRGAFPSDAFSLGRCQARCRLHAGRRREMADFRVWRLGREQHLSLSTPSLHVAQEQEAFP